jgi:hypothetical protein
MVGLVLALHMYFGKKGSSLVHHPLYADMSIVYSQVALVAASA